MPIDLRLTRRSIPYVVTAHNLWPHHGRRTCGLRVALADVYRHARRTIAHSAEAARLFASRWRVNPDSIIVIPHGNLAEGISLPTPEPPQRPFALCFGAIAPYKGLEEVIKWWRLTEPGVELRISGGCSLPDYLRHLEDIASSDPLIRICPVHQTDQELAETISAASCVILNHTTGLTSGAACLTRSLGTCVLLPDRLTAVDLHEPHETVFRFKSLDHDFGEKLNAALRAPKRGVDQAWWNRTSWSSVASLTIQVYRDACNGRIPA